MLCHQLGLSSHKNPVLMPFGFQFAANVDPRELTLPTLKLKEIIISIPATWVY